MKRLKNFVVAITTVVCSMALMAGCGSGSNADGTYSYKVENEVTYGDEEFTSYQTINLIMKGNEYTIQCLSSTGPTFEGGSFAGRWMSGSVTVDGDTVTCEVPTKTGSMLIELSDDNSELVVAAEPDEQDIDLSEFRLPAGEWYNDDFSSSWTIDAKNGTCEPAN